MPSEETKILEFSKYQKFDKATFHYSCRSWMYNRTDWWM